MKFKKYRDLILGIIALAISAAYLFYTAQIKKRPKLTPSYASARTIPYLLGILLAIIAVLLILQGIRKMRAYDESRDAGEKMSRTDLTAVALTFIVIIGYILLLQPLGFCLATVLYLFLQMLVLAPKEKRNLPLFACVSVGFTAVIFVAFRVGLQQLLPRGVIESLLGF